MPLLRNIAGFRNVGLIQDTSPDMVKVLPDEGAGGGGGTDYTPKEGPIYPVEPPVDPYYDYPKDVEPVYPVEPIVPIYPEEVKTSLPAPNQLPVTPPAGSPGKLLPILALASIVLASTGMHPFKKVGNNVLLAGGLALLYFQLSRLSSTPAGGSGITQPNTL